MYTVHYTDQSPHGGGSLGCIRFDYTDQSPHGGMWFSGVYTVYYTDQSSHGGGSLGCIQLTILATSLMEVVLWGVYS